MKAITTKFLPCTNTKGSRIKASDGDGNSVTISNDHGESWSNGDNHAKAAVALCRKMGWHGILIRGATKDGWVFVWSDADRTAVCSED